MQYIVVYPPLTANEKEKGHEVYFNALSLFHLTCPPQAAGDVGAKRRNPGERAFLLAYKNEA